jgi:transcriptional regulator with XRE-family HTH domain
MNDKPKVKRYVLNDRLFEIIKNKSGTIAEAAREIGTSRQWLWQIVNRDKKCSYALAKEIEKYTNFRIPATSLMETDYEVLVENRRKATG